MKSQAKTAQATAAPVVIALNEQVYCDELHVNMSTKIGKDRYDIIGSTMVFTAPDWRLTVVQRPVFGRISGARNRLDVVIKLLTDEENLPTMPCVAAGSSCMA